MKFCGKMLADKKLFVTFAPQINKTLFWNNNNQTKII